jgi:hypothetical protein
MKAIWTTQDGMHIDIEDMSDAHIVNTIDMLRRNADSNYESILLDAYCAAEAFHGEIAQDCAFAAINELEDADPDDVLEQDDCYKALCKEAKKRGIYHEM